MVDATDFEDHTKKVCTTPCLVAQWPFNIFFNAFNWVYLNFWRVYGGSSIFWRFPILRSFSAAFFVISQEKKNTTNWNLILINKPFLLKIKTSQMLNIMQISPNIVSNELIWNRFVLHMDDGLNNNLEKKRRHKREKPTTRRYLFMALCCVRNEIRLHTHTHTRI